MPSVFHKSIFLPALRWLFLLVTVTALGACSWLVGGEQQSSSAELLAPLEIPPDLVTPVGDPRLARPVLPKRTASKPMDTSAMVCQCSEPPKIGEKVLPAGKGVQRMRDGSRRWLSVQAEPEQVWPLVRKFLDIRGYRVLRDEPAIGLLETDWKARYVEEKGADDTTSDGQTNWRESLRIRIEPSEQTGRADVFLSQRNSQRMTGGSESESGWELRPVNEDRAVEMLNRLAQYLAGENVMDAVPLQPLAARIDVNSSENTVIVVEARFDLTWRRTALALTNLGFTIEDRDRTNRLFHIYNDLSAGLTETELKHGKKKSATVREEYWIRVQEVGESTHISVRNKADRVDESQVAQHLLTLLLAQLK